MIVSYKRIKGGKIKYATRKRKFIIDVKTPSWGPTSIDLYVLRKFDPVTKYGRCEFTP